MALISADAAAARLGVKVETIYAYVSRGLLERFPSPDGRGSCYDERTIASLAARGRPRRATQRGAMNLTLTTHLTQLTPQGVRYRGVLAADLAAEHTFEQVAELLWTGQLPEHYQHWQAVGPTAVSLPPTSSIPGRLRAVAAQLIDHPELAAPAGRPTAVDVVADGPRIIATLVNALAPLGDARTPRLVLGRSGEAVALRSTIAAQLATRLAVRRPTPEIVRLINTVLVVMADHELAASTLGVRVAASTWASPAAVVSTGMGILSGQLHGSASAAARSLLVAADEIGAARAVATWLKDGRRLPGFGHRVYPGADPRAELLLRELHHIQAAGGASRQMRRALTIADDVRSEVVDRIDRHPNVDFALATIGIAAGLVPDAGEALMSVSRTAGWLAHAIEEYAEAPLRFRSRAAYIGDGASVKDREFTR